MEIRLAQGLVALLDDCDARLAEHSWHARAHRKTFYAVRYVRSGGRKRLVQLHREVLGLRDPRVGADHRNGNGLDCRRENLRVATNVENSRNRTKRSDNTSGFKGVHRRPGTERWRAYIYDGGKQVALGDHATAEAAARAYDAAARDRFGAFAALNFPEKTERAA